MMKKRTRSSTRFLARLLILCSMVCPLYIKTTKLYIITQMMSSVIDKYSSAVAADLNFGTLRFEPSAAEPSQNALDSIRGLLGLSRQCANCHTAPREHPRRAISPLAHPRRPGGEVHRLIVIDHGRGRVLRGKKPRKSGAGNETLDRKST